LTWPKATSGRDKFTFDASSRIRELTARSASDSRVSFAAEPGCRRAILDVMAAKSSRRFATLSWLSGEVLIASFMLTTWASMRSRDLASACASFLNSWTRMSRNFSSATSSSERVKHVCEFMDTL
jgi:hypothetical protein